MPNLFADVRNDVTECRVFLDGTEVGVFPVQSPGLFAYDISGVSNGAHTAELTSIVNDPVWGLQESAHSSPLSFVRPDQPPAPASLRLAP